MVKWIDEKVLQYYFRENCTKYALRIEGEKKIISKCDFNQPFDKFPDLICVIDGKEVPVEVEWLSSHYDHDKKTPNEHTKFEREGGFLVVFDKDTEISNLKQIIIDRKDFRSWFKKNVDKVFDESVKSFMEEVLAKRKYPKIQVVYLGSAMDENYSVGKSKGIWGFTDGRFEMSKNLIRDIKKGDIILFFGPVKGVPVRISQEEFLKRIKKDNNIRIKHIAAYKITSDYYNEREKGSYEVIWPDENQENKRYPHRFLFNKNPIFDFKDIQFNKIAVATQKSMWHKMLTSPNEIEYPDFVELIRNFTFKKD